MRIHTKDAEKYIHALVNTIIKDPASLESWTCTNIKFNRAPQNEYEHDVSSIIAELKNCLRGIECDIMQSSEHDIFLISKTVNRTNLYELQEHILDMFPNNREMITIVIYDIFRDWQQVKELLEDNLQSPSLVIDLSRDEANFGEIDALKEVFEEARKLRKARTPLHILLAEDDQLTRRIVANLFSEYVVITAADGREAVTNYLLYAPDIAFLDINMPEYNGFQVLNMVTSIDPDAYVVMFSANSSFDNVTNAINSGAVGFISKPFRKEKMLHYISDYQFIHRKEGK